MECNPVDTPLVALKDMFGLYFCPSEHFSWPGPSLLHAPFLESCKVPYPDSLIKGSTSYQGIIRMEGSTHDIVTMACKDSNDTPALPIPQSHALIITARKNPRQLRMELDSTHIVSMTSESKHAFLRFVIPDFDSMVITAADKHWLRVMKGDTTNRTYMK